MKLLERIAARNEAEKAAMVPAQKAVVNPDAIVSREWIDNKTDAEMKEAANAQLQNPNTKPIGDHPVGSLKAVACRCTGGSADGRPGRWEVLYEWVPV